MRVFIAVLVLVFSLQSLVRADDIRDFEIEGMSIGDSALKYYSESKINNKDLIDYFKNKKFFSITIYPEKSDYNTIGLTFKSKDKKYIFHAINGGLHFDNNKQCLKKKDNIIKEVSSMFKEAEKVDSGKRDYAADPTGESKTYSVYYWIKGAFIEISCYDLTQKLAKEKKWIKNILNVGVVSKEFSDFLLNEEYPQ